MMNPDKLKLFKECMALYEQEQQEQQPSPDCLHDFNYDSSYGEKVCLNCGLIDPHPLPIISTVYYRPRNVDKGVYLRKCITHHEDQCNCSIPYYIYADFGKFQRCFIEKLSNEPKISVRYILYI